jgi:methylmalonyl-CoA mutase cobalamin-binding subunit
LATITWSALVIAICVGQQRAATRQREVIEQLKAAGMLPLTYVNGRPVPPAHHPAPAGHKTF